MSLRYVFVDFDETLFGHYDYLAWFDSELDKDGLLPGGSGSFSRSIDDYHDVRSQRPLLRLYKHAEHLTDVTGQQWPFISGEMEKKMARRSGDFCYPDSHEFLEWLKEQDYDSRLLTYGDGEYQRFKIGLCHGTTAHFPVHVTQNPKTQFLTEEFPNEQGVLIDDKYPLDLPDNWHHIWLTRDKPMKKPRRLSPRVHQASTLGQAKQIIGKL